MTVTIDLGGAEPWTPPDTSRPRRRITGRARWSAAVLVAALAAGLPAASPAAAGPVLRIRSGAQSSSLGGGRVFVTRYPGESPHRLEAYSGAGAPLWGTDLEESQRFAYADADNAVLDVRLGDAPALSTVTVLDARTGTARWAKGGVLVLGRAGPVVLLEDTSQWQPLSAGTPPVGPAQTRILAVDARTGAPAWELTVPDADPISLRWAPTRPYDLTSLDVLDPAGELRAYDLVTGAVTRTDRLRLAGAPNWFELGEHGAGGPPGARAGQVAVGSEDGTDVYERGSGRPLWHSDPAGPGRLTGCAPGLWCREATGSPVVAYDAGTGREAWRVDGFDLVIGVGEQRHDRRDGTAGAPSIVLGAGVPGSADVSSGLVVDAATGAVRARIDGWYPAVAGGGIVLWRHDDGVRDAVLGLLDPGTGRIAVFGAGDLRGGMPSCAVDGGLVACAAGGDLAVWPVPPAGRR